MLNTPAHMLFSPSLCAHANITPTPYTPHRYHANARSRVATRGSVPAARRHDSRVATGAHKSKHAHAARQKTCACTALTRACIHRHVHSYAYLGPACAMLTCHRAYTHGRRHDKCTHMAHDTQTHTHTHTHTCQPSSMPTHNHITSACARARRVKTTVSLWTPHNVCCGTIQCGAFTPSGGRHVGERKSPPVPQPCGLRRGTPLHRTPGTPPYARGPRRPTRARHCQHARENTQPWGSRKDASRLPRVHTRHTQVSHDHYRVGARSFWGPTGACRVRRWARGAGWRHTRASWGATMCT